VTDDDAARTHPGDEPFQPSQAVEVEVVGRFVQQEHVEAGEEQRRQADPSRFPAGEHRQPFVQQPFRQAEVRPHIGHTRVEVGRAQRQPTVECIAVRIARISVAGSHRRSRRVQRRRRRGDPGASFQMLAHRLVSTLRFLGQVTDVGGRR